MARRRSTVRFRKGAPGYSTFSNVGPHTSFARVAFEWHTVSSKKRTTRHSPDDEARTAERFLFGEEVRGERFAALDARLQPAWWQVAECWGAA
jgi:hypothetical protein